MTLDDHIADLMNNRKYDEVIGTIDSLSEADKSKPQYLLYRAQAFCGKAGFDLITLTKISSRAMNFDEVERSFWRVLKPDNTPPAAGDKSQINMVKSLVTFAAYMKILESLPESKEIARPLMMEGLVTLERIPEGADAYYRKARTQSFMLHTLVVLSSIKKSIRQNAGQADSTDIFCMIDANVLSADFEWMMEHLSGAIDDGVIVKKINEGDLYKPGQLPAIGQRVKELLSGPSKFSVNTLSSGLIASQGLQCAQ